MRPRIPTLVMLAASAAGLYFSGYLTSDFVEHLDRQTHDIHCSFIPGLLASDPSAASGCHAALMSPYSSVFRDALWGGLPIALPGMAVFAYLLYRSVELIVNKRDRDVHAARFAVAAWLVPLLTSAVFGYIAATQLSEFCKLCVGIYSSSAVGFGAAIALAVGAGKTAAPLQTEEGEEVAEDEAPAGPGPTPWGQHIVGVVEGVVFVGVAVGLYFSFVPNFDKYIGTCGTLEKPEDPYGVMVSLGAHHTGKATIEVLDPLCPSCAGFEKRLVASGLDAELDRKAVLFPLDNTCNWMISSALHPGACAVSEAVLCAGENADKVIAWAFEHSEEVRTAATADPTAAATMVAAAFPEVKDCLGTAAAKQKLNRSLRWAVANHLQVLTPQVYVEGTKLCDEDTDMGMDWALTRLLAKGASTPTPTTPTEVTP